MNKADVFEKELELIQMPLVRTYTEKMLERLPDYFFSIPASSSGKYHPSYALGEGGLVRHTRAAFHIAHTLLQLDMYKEEFKQIQDYILSAILLHDGFKSGLVQENRTSPEHPILIAKWLVDGANACGFPIHLRNFIGELIASHMGQWNKDREGNVILPVPITSAQRFVHMVDYLASRKFIEINFDQV